MLAKSRRLVLTIALAALMPLAGPPASMQQSASRRPIELQDIIDWKAIAATTVSNDGQWFAYRLGPGEGDAQVVVRSTRTGKETTFEIGEPGGGGGGAAGGGPAAAAGVGGASLDFSEDSKWVAFTTYPKRAEAQRLRRQRRPVQNGVTIVNLATGEKHEYREDPAVCVLRRLVHVDRAEPVSGADDTRRRRRRGPRGGRRRTRWRRRCSGGGRTERSAARDRSDSARAGHRPRVERRQRRRFRVLA